MLCHFCCYSKKHPQSKIKSLQIQYANLLFISALINFIISNLYNMWSMLKQIQFIYILYGDFFFFFLQRHAVSRPCNLQITVFIFAVFQHNVLSDIFISFIVVCMLHLGVFTEFTLCFPLVSFLISLTKALQSKSHDLVLRPCDVYVLASQIGYTASLVTQVKWKQKRKMI